MAVCEVFGNAVNGRHVSSLLQTVRAELLETLHRWDLCVTVGNVKYCRIIGLSSG